MSSPYHQHHHSQFLRDVLSVHNFVMFSHYHFETYSCTQFNKDYNNAINKCKDFVDKKEIVAVKSDNTNPINFHPTFQINNDLFEIFISIFNVTHMFKIYVVISAMINAKHNHYWY